MSHETKMTDFSIEKLLRVDDFPKSKTKPRRRSSFSAMQVHWLETEFRCHRYVSPERRAGLAAILGLSQQQIKIWFQNRRYKTKFRESMQHAETSQLTPDTHQHTTVYSPQIKNLDYLTVLNNSSPWNMYCFNLLMSAAKSEKKDPKVNNAANSNDGGQ